MELTSPDFAGGEAIPVHCTCDGDDVSPVLRWDDVPEGCVELALACTDPDAPSGTFVHWALWRIEPDVRELGGGDVPPGIRQGRNDFGRVGYGGPCPPEGHGPHRYRFTLYAVSEQIDVPDGAGLPELRGAIEGTTLATAELVGAYER